MQVQCMKQGTQSSGTAQRDRVGEEGGGGWDEGTRNLCVSLVDDGKTHHNILK